MPDPLYVVAGVLLDPAGRVLLAQRPPGKHLAGMWEFPGGKLEPGESPLEGLARELHEELDIHLAPDSATQLVRVPWTYAGRALLLDAWRVLRWAGTPRSMEGQALQWRAPHDVELPTLAPADRVILQTLAAGCTLP